MQRWQGRPASLVGSRRMSASLLVSGPGSPLFFEACRWRERECVVTEPGRSDLPRWIARRVPSRARRGAGNPQPLWHQSGWALDPRRAVHRCRCPAHRFRQDGRRPLSDPPATPPSPATGIDIDIRRAGIARAVAENTTTIADQPTEEPVVSRTVRRACMTVRLFDKPRSRRC